VQQAKSALEMIWDELPKAAGVLPRTPPLKPRNQPRAKDCQLRRLAARALQGSTPK
jgi:hypothetical protein